MSSSRAAGLLAVLACALLAGMAGAQPPVPGARSPQAIAISNKDYPRLNPPVSSDAQHPTLYFNGSFTAWEMGSSMEGQTLADFVAAVVAGNLYSNVHTLEKPGGLIRGQLVLESTEGGVSTITCTMSGQNQVSDNAVVPVDTPTAAMLVLRVRPADDVAEWRLNVTSVVEMVSSHVHGGNTTSNGAAVALLAPAAPPAEAPVAAAPEPAPAPVAAPLPPNAARAAGALWLAAAGVGAAWLLL